MGKPSVPRKKPNPGWTKGTTKPTKRLTNNRNMTLGNFFSSVPTVHNLKQGVNIYDQLRDNESQHPPQSKRNMTNVSPKIPPIIVTDKQHDMNKILVDIGIVKFNLKLISIGTKIFMENNDDVTKAVTYLKENNVDFFSHASKNQKICKVVLSGLPEVPIETIKSELEVLNVHSTQINLMSSRNPNPHRALYLVHLTENITFHDVQKIKVIYHTMVSWAKYRPRFQGPTQCRNCSMYGHGTQNCHRKPVCTLCASTSHNQSTCPLKTLDKTTTPVYKCSYCANLKLQSVNHRASDPECPGRQAYLKTRMTTFNQQRNRRNQPMLYNSIKDNTTFVPAPIPSPLTRTFSSVAADGNKNDQAASISEDLFTTAELLEIFKNAISRIKNCKSKLDQIQVIADLINHVI